MTHSFPTQPVPVATTIKQLHDQVHACKQWIDATKKHSITVIFFAKVNGFDVTNLLKLESAMLNDLSPEALQHLDNFFQAVADEQCSRKMLLEHNQESITALQNFNSSLKRNFNHDSSKH